MKRKFPYLLYVILIFVLCILYYISERDKPTKKECGRKTNGTCNCECGLNGEKYIKPMSGDILSSVVHINEDMIVDMEVEFRMSDFGTDCYVNGNKRNDLEICQAVVYGTGIEREMAIGDLMYALSVNGG